MISETKLSNILMIVSDQHRFDSFDRPIGGIELTPSISRLANQGRRFDRAFTPCALCSPTRCSILTGLYPHNHGVLTNVHDHHTRSGLNPRNVTFSSILHSRGFNTGYVGKWHVSQEDPPSEFGFTDSLPERAPLENKPGVDHDAWTHPVTNATLLNMAYGSLVLGGTRTEPIEVCQEHRAVDDAIQLMRKYAEANKRGQPFLLRVDFQGPHLPYVIPEPYASMFSPDAIEDDPTVDANLDDKPAIQKMLVEWWGSGRYSRDEWKVLRALYYGYIRMIDDEIGRLLSVLEVEGLADSTAVLYFSDHGDAIGSRRMIDKGYCGYDEQYRVPFVIRWPGRCKEGTRSLAYINLVDVAPTIVEIATGSPTGFPTTNGRSIVPFITSEEPDSQSTHTVSEFHGMQWGLYSQRIVRTETAKLVFNACDRSEFYDLRSDPHELVNRHEDTALAGARDECYRLLFRWMNRSEDPIASDPFVRRAYIPTLPGPASTGR